MNWKRAKKKIQDENPELDHAWKTLLKPSSSGQKAEVMWSRAAFKVTLSSGHNLLPIFGQPLLPLRVYGRNMKL